MTSGIDLLNELIEELDLKVVDNEHAVGEISETPTSLIVLSAEPLSMMFGFQIKSCGLESQPFLNLLDGISEDQAKVSISKGIAWLSLYEFEGATTEAVKGLVLRAVDAIESSDLHSPPGCTKCGASGGAEIICVDGQAKRICERCLTTAIEHHREKESRANRASLASALTLPGACAIVSIIWALSWTGIDMVLDFFRIVEIELNRLTMLLIGVTVLGSGSILGILLGSTLRRSIAVRRAPVLMSGLLTILSVVCGEVVYVAVLFIRFLGIFDLNRAARAMGFVVASYSSFWIVCKLAVGMIMAVACYQSAIQTKKHKLEV